MASPRRRAQWLEGRPPSALSPQALVRTWATYPKDLLQPQAANFLRQQTFNFANPQPANPINSQPANPLIQHAATFANSQPVNFFSHQGVKSVKKRFTREDLHRAAIKQKQIADNWDARNGKLLNTIQRNYQEGRGDPAKLEVARRVGFFPVLPGSNGAQEEQEYQAWGLANIAVIESQNLPQDPRNFPQAYQSRSNTVSRLKRPGGSFNSQYQQAAQQNGPSQNFATGSLDSSIVRNKETEVRDFEPSASTGAIASPFGAGFSNFSSGQRIQPPTKQPYSLVLPNFARSLSRECRHAIISTLPGQASHQSNNHDLNPVSAPGGRQGGGRVPAALYLQHAMDKTKQVRQQNGGRAPPGQPTPQDPNIQGASHDSQRGVMSSQNLESNRRSKDRPSPHSPSVPNPAQIEANRLALLHYAQGPNISEITASKISQEQQKQMIHRPTPLEITARRVAILLFWRGQPPSLTDAVKSASTKKARGFQLTKQEITALNFIRQRISQAIKAYIDYPSQLEVDMRMPKTKGSGLRSSPLPQGGLKKSDASVIPGAGSSQSHQTMYHDLGQAAGTGSRPGYPMPHTQIPIGLHRSGLPSVNLPPGMMSTADPLNPMNPHDSRRRSNTQKYTTDIMPPPNLTSRAGSTKVAHTATPQSLNQFNNSILALGTSQPPAAHLSFPAPGNSQQQAASSSGPVRIIKAPRNGYPHPAAFLADTPRTVNHPPEGRLFLIGEPRLHKRQPGPGHNLIPQVAPARAVTTQAVHANFKSRETTPEKVIKKARVCNSPHHQEQ